jgi:protein gp37
MILVKSVSDLFHEEIPAEVVQRVFATMNAAYCHAFQVLGK